MIFGLGTVSSVTVQAQLAFVVLNTQVPANPLSIDGYHALGDEIRIQLLPRSNCKY